MSIDFSNEEFSAEQPLLNHLSDSGGRRRVLLCGPRLLKDYTGQEKAKGNLSGVY